MSEVKVAIEAGPPGDEAGKGEQTQRLESPPPAGMPAREAVDPGAKLHEMARELVRTRNRRALLEYLRLRRAVR